MVMSEGRCDVLAPSTEEALDGETIWDILFLACSVL